MGSKQWILLEQNQDLARELALNLGIHPLIAQILINRGIATSEQGRAFLQCDLHKTPDPFLMLGMEQAVERVKLALERGEKIVIYGDYDADGQTATALLVSALRELARRSEQISYYLPDRLDEGYGLHRDALAELAQTYTLLITVDCGISAVGEVAFAQSLGLDIIITDHHEPGPVLPAAVAILNPKQEGCSYPSKELAGVGVALKLVQGLGVDEWVKYLDLVTLGTVADLVPLRGENRTWVQHGLKYMETTKNLGIKTLMAVSEVEKPTAGHVGFKLGPRLNAVGRLGDPTRGVRLLLTQEQGEAHSLALELDSENSLRQDLEAKVLEEAISTVEKYQLNQRSALVVWGEGWHQGVVGIVASRLVERYYLPTVVISVQDGQGTASARSIVGLDLYSTLTSCEHLLIKYGGHTMAAGLSLPVENFLAFQQCFELLCAKELQREDYVPKLFIDGIACLEDITPELIEELAALEPHGIGNPGPTLQAQVSVVRTRVLGQENRHLQLAVQDETATDLQCIAFGFGSCQDQIERSAENVELAFVPRFNHWNNEKTIQLHVQAWQAGSGDGGYVEQWMAERYPWQLTAPFYLSTALQREGEVKSSPPFLTVDLRGTWNKVEALEAQRGPEDRTLILVNTPLAALEVCRSLRIAVPGGRKFIGFEHERLTSEERLELEQSPPTWLVSTGYNPPRTPWPSVWLWEPPLNPSNYLTWANLVEVGGELVGVYGPKDVQMRQTYLQQVCPNRQTLAQIYRSLRQPHGQIDLARAQERLTTLGLLGGLPIAIGVFQELGLWDVTDDRIIYRPAPPQKLDLNQTVLYNKVTLLRKQSSDYLKRSLERGFFQDGLKREN